MVHNVTAATRLLDVLPIVACDPRVQVVFTRTGSSELDAGTTEFLNRNGIVELPWERALTVGADLAIAASYGGELHRIPAPLMVLPHGIGYNKYLKSKIENRKSVFGLSRPWLMHEGRLVPSVIILSHPEQLERLRAACPEAVDAALVAGDPCFDRMLASLPLRETYRQALGVAPGQRLIVLSSTWAEPSLYGSKPMLARELAARLPLDDYRLALALHPNIHAGHSPWQVRLWTEACARAGVLVLAQEDLWRPALVAADLTIGDHGSVTFYSAALGTPVLLAAAPEHTVDPASPIGQLLATAPRLGADPRTQIEQTIAAHDPACHAPITERTTALPGASVPVLRRTIYRLLDLPEPADGPDLTALPVPEVTPPEPGAQLVRAEPRPDGAGGLTATVRRYPAEALAEPAHAPADAHLVVSTSEPNTRLLDLADVLVHEGSAEAAEWIKGTLAALPGCALAMAPAGERDWLVGGAACSPVRLTEVTGRAALFASVLYAWLAAGRSLAELPERLSLRVAGREYSARLSRAHPAGPAPPARGG
ncbi:hypothetical protein [Amycolatopsis aidingensis]|uniref:hypothetical protein n=1 Tax=Amycolatopsis aidingensis TaxID=2842453 RepID=UPI001C0ADA31|nr:hypothetical protein [Amycolatopsis aidingensis]